VCALTGCHGSSSPHKSRPHALRCRLQVAGRRAGRAVVSYDDTTGDPSMSAAIKSEVAAWNASSAPVMLVPSTRNPGITFQAVTSKATVSPCSGTAPRTVTVQLNTAKWHAASTVPGAVKDPIGAIARLIGRALGLQSGGKCPLLTSPNSCPQRAETPGPAETQVLQKLYASATPSPTS
jgi:hypothetical protein